LPVPRSNLKLYSIAGSTYNPGRKLNSNGLDRHRDS
jgi:hypothetical protein